VAACFEDFQVTVLVLGREAWFVGMLLLADDNGKLTRSSDQQRSCLVCGTTSSVRRWASTRIDNILLGH
jgi:hypothetical protein